MHLRWMHRITISAMFFFSLAALGTILTAVVPILVTGRVSPPARDEGTQAHIFQLSVVALLPVGLAFLGTADWKKPWRTGSALAVPAAAVLAAFTLLYYFEHVIY